MFDRLQNFIAATDPALLDAFWFMEHNTPEAIAARRAALQPPAAPEGVSDRRHEFQPGPDPLICRECGQPRYSTVRGPDHYHVTRRKPKATR